MSIHPLAAAAFWIAVILAMTAGFFYALQKWSRRRVRGGVHTANELMAEFRELHSRGELSDAEYGRIKEKLAPQLQLELTGAGGAETMAEAADVLKETARSMLSARNLGAGVSDQGEANGAAGGAGQEGCDAAPPNGGDSTKERR